MPSRSLPLLAAAAVLAAACSWLAWEDAARAAGGGDRCPARPGFKCAIVYDMADGWLMLNGTDSRLAGSQRVDLTADTRDVTRKRYDLLSSSRCVGKVVWLEYGEDGETDKQAQGTKSDRTLFQVAFRGIFEPAFGFRSTMTPKFPC